MSELAPKILKGQNESRRELQNGGPSAGANFDCFGFCFGKDFAGFWGGGVDGSWTCFQRGFDRFLVGLAQGEPRSLLKLKGSDLLAPLADWRQLEQGCLPRDMGSGTSSLANPPC